MHDEDENAAQRRLTWDIRRLNAAKVCHSAIFVLPVLLPYFQRQIGLDFQQLLIGEAAFAAVIVVMEVPSGWLADIWGRKRALCLGYALNAVCYMLLWAADGFWLAITAQALIGVGISLISGADVALLYDRLAEREQTQRYRKLEGLRHGLGLYSVAGASLAGGVMYSIDPYLPVLATAAAEAVAALITLGVREPARRRQPVEGHPIADILSAVRRAVRARPELAYLFPFAAALWGTSINGYWVQQPYFLHAGIPLIWFGGLAALTHLLGGLGSTCGHWLERRWSQSDILLALTALLAGAYALMTLDPGLSGIALLMLSSVIWGVSGPIFYDMVNARVDEARRATMISVAGLGVRLAFVPISLTVGALQDRYGIVTAIGFLPLPLLFVALPVFLVYRRIERLGNR